MSIIYCHDCDNHFDSDYETECPKCEQDGDQERADQEERATQQAEIHNHPSEGQR